MKNGTPHRVRKLISTLLILSSLLCGPLLVIPSLTATAQTVPEASDFTSAAGSGVQMSANPEQATTTAPPACLTPSSDDVSTQTITPSALSNSLQGSVPPPIATGAASPLSVMPAAFQLHMVLTFEIRNAASFQTCLNAINDPNSSYFHDFLTATTLEPYLPTPGEKSSVATYLESSGFQVANGSSPLTLQLTATVAVAEAVLGVKEDVFGENGAARFYAPATNPSMPENLAGLISGIEGLENYTSAFPVESPCSGPYCPQGIQVGYSLTSLYGSGDNGAGETVAIADEPGDPNMQSAINTYDAQYGLAPTTLSILFPDGTPSSWDPGWASETTMDVEAVHTVAPGAGIVLLYGSSPADDPLNLDDYVAANHLASIVSNSWGYGCASGPCSDTQLPSSEVSSTDSRLAVDSAMGLTILFASGDSGARPDGTNLGTEFPSSDPNVLAIGATNLNLAGCGTSTCSGYSSETGAVISGGGYSGYFAEPSWQKAAIGSTSGRAVPDISMMGYAPNFWVYSTASDRCGVGGDSAGWFPCAGTSLSTPLWAAIIAIILQVKGGPALGNFGPALWQLASSSSYAADFHDVTSGSNNGYSAGLGWDPVTGWGSPMASNLVASEKTITGSIKLTVAESGAPTTVFGLSGCSVSISSVPGDGTAHSFTATPGCSITVTAPGAGANTRYLFAGGSSTESFTTCATGTCAEQDYAYYYQLSQSVGLAVVGGGSPSVSLTNTQFGGSIQTPLSTTAAKVWTDYGTSASVPAAVAGAAGERWITSTTSWTITASNIITNPISYQHQYFLTVSITPTGGGTTAPSSEWVASGSTLSITATPSSGFTFQNWSCTGVGCFSGTSNPTPSITINNPVTETAIFQTGSHPTSLDGHANVDTSGSSATLILTTSSANDVIIAMAGGQQGAAPTIGDTGGLTWILRTHYDDGSRASLYEWYAIAGSTLSSDRITISSKTTYNNYEVFGVSGANTASPFDPNSGLPALASSAASGYPRVSVSTSNPNDLVFGGQVTSYCGSSLAAGTGFTLIDSNSPPNQNGAYEYELVSSTQSGLSMAWGSGGCTAGSDSGNVHWIMIGDAIQQASSTPLDPTTTGVTPNPSSVAAGKPITFIATVTDTSSTPTTPAGTVSWSDGGKGGSFSGSGLCTLSTASSSSGTCSTSYTAPSTGGIVTITASYPGDSAHSSSSGTSSLTVIASTSSLGLDGHANVDTSGSSATLTLTTSSANDVIIAMAGGQQGAAPTIGDTGGLTWILRTHYDDGSKTSLYEWYAIASSPLSSDRITITSNLGYNNYEVFGVSGANTASPFDPNSGLPALASSGTSGYPHLSLSTSNAADFIFAGEVTSYCGSSLAAGTGFTGIYTDASNQNGAYEYELVSSTQSGLSMAWGSGGCTGGSDGGNTHWIMIGDAIQDPATRATTEGTGALARAQPTVFALDIHTGAGDGTGMTGSDSASVRPVSAASPTLTLAGPLSAISLSAHDRMTEPWLICAPVSMRSPSAMFPS